MDLGIYKILRDYSDGQLGWRDAASRLNIDDFEEFHALLREHRLPFYEPTPEASAAKMALIDDWLDEI